MAHMRQIITRMALFVFAVTAIGIALIDPLQTAFMANPAINGLIIGILFVGIIYIFRQVWILRPEIQWISKFRKNSDILYSKNPPRLLAPMSNMLGDIKNKNTKISTISMTTLLDGISSRLHESREIARYLTGLLIFLGLLGTFWGLLQTINSVGGAIGSLQLEGGDFNNQFNSLKEGLEAPLQGMGTAFSSSLFGLAGSLILGFLDLQANQAQNRFYNDLEEWLSGLTKLSGSNTLIESDQSVPAYVQALLEQTADSLDNLRRTVSSAEKGRQSSDTNISNLAENLSMLTDQMRSEQDLMIKLVQSQIEIRPILEKLAESESLGNDKLIHSHLRNIDSYTGQLVEQTARGQEQMLQELRNEIKLLAKTIAASMTNINKRT